MNAKVIFIGAALSLVSACGPATEPIDAGPPCAEPMSPCDTCVCRVTTPYVGTDEAVQCVTTSLAARPLCAPYCASTADCPSSFVCERSFGFGDVEAPAAGACHRVDDDWHCGTCRPGCTTDGDCPPGLECRAGFRYPDGVDHQVCS